jgi:peptidoglycan LD-endopeptidase CwlK
VAVSRRLEDLDAEVCLMALELARRAAAEGIILVFTHTTRTALEQQELYEQGRSRPGPIVTAAPAGYSWHEFGRAFDVAIKRWSGDQTPGNWYDGPWDRVGELGEACGLEWGGRWKHPDYPHFQHTGGRTLAAMREERNATEAKA